MNKYINEKDAIIGLHERGFIHDFQLTGNGLLWVQGKILVRAGDFSILELHRFRPEKDRVYGIMVFGVFAYYHNAKGILIKHSRLNEKNTSPVINKKINEKPLLGEKITEDIN